MSNPKKSPLFGHPSSSSFSFSSLPSHPTILSLFGFSSVSLQLSSSSSNQTFGESQIFRGSLNLTEPLMEVDFASDGTQLSYLCLKTRRKVIRAGDPPAEVQNWKVGGGRSREKGMRRMKDKGREKIVEGRGKKKEGTKRKEDEAVEKEGGDNKMEGEGKKEGVMEEEREEEKKIEEEEGMEEEEEGIKNEDGGMEEEARAMEEEGGEEDEKKGKEENKRVKIVGVWGYGRSKITGIGFFYQEEEEGGKDEEEEEEKEEEKEKEEGKEKEAYKKYGEFEIIFIAAMEENERAKRFCNFIKRNERSILLTGSFDACQLELRKLNQDSRDYKKVLICPQWDDRFLDVLNKMDYIIYFPSDLEGFNQDFYKARRNQSPQGAWRKNKENLLKLLRKAEEEEITVFLFENRGLGKVFGYQEMEEQYQKMLMKMREEEGKGDVQEEIERLSKLEWKNFSPNEVRIGLKYYFSWAANFLNEIFFGLRKLEGEGLGMNNLSLEERFLKRAYLISRLHDEFNISNENKGALKTVLLNYKDQNNMIFSRGLTSIITKYIIEIESQTRRILNEIDDLSLKLKSTQKNKKASKTNEKERKKKSLKILDQSAFFFEIYQKSTDQSNCLKILDILLEICNHPTLSQEFLKSQEFLFLLVELVSQKHALFNIFGQLLFKKAIGKFQYEIIASLKRRKGENEKISKFFRNLLDNFLSLSSPILTLDFQSIIIHKYMQNIIKKYEIFDFKFFFEGNYENCDLIEESEITHLQDLLLVLFETFKDYEESVNILSILFVLLRFSREKIVLSILKQKSNLLKISSFCSQFFLDSPSSLCQQAFNLYSITIHSANKLNLFFERNQEERELYDIINSKQSKRRKKLSKTDLSKSSLKLSYFLLQDTEKTFNSVYNYDLKNFYQNERLSQELKKEASSKTQLQNKLNEVQALTSPLKEQIETLNNMNRELESEKFELKSLLSAKATNIIGDMQIKNECDVEDVDFQSELFQNLTKKEISVVPQDKKDLALLFDENNENSSILNPNSHLTKSQAKKFILCLQRTRLGLKELRSSICGALKFLGEELYSSKIHFFWELIQNAEDNSYQKNEHNNNEQNDQSINEQNIKKNEENNERNEGNADNKQRNIETKVFPFLKVFLNSKSAIFFNNEVGFKAKDVLSLCQIGKSTKTGGGAIGRKGLGFKSVFGCSDTPVVISEPFEFCFRFDGMDEMGYITPYYCQKGGKEEGVGDGGEEVEKKEEGMKMDEGGRIKEEEDEEKEEKGVEIKEEKEGAVELEEEEGGGNRKERRRMEEEEGRMEEEGRRMEEERKKGKEEDGYGKYLKPWKGDDYFLENWERSQTKIVLPFKKDYGLEKRNEIIEGIWNEFDENILLNLEKIREISLTSTTNEGKTKTVRWIKEVKSIQEEGDIIFQGKNYYSLKKSEVDLVERNISNKELFRKNFIVFQASIEIPAFLCAEEHIPPSRSLLLLAFPSSLPSSSSYPIYAFLPVAKENPGFGFILNANWSLTTNRESLRSNDFNVFIRNHAALFLVYSLLQAPTLKSRISLLLPEMDGGGENRKIGGEGSEIEAKRGGEGRGKRVGIEEEGKGKEIRGGGRGGGGWWGRLVEDFWEEVGKVGVGGWLGIEGEVVYMKEEVEGLVGAEEMMEVLKGVYVVDLKRIRVDERLRRKMKGVGVEHVVECLENEGFFQRKKPEKCFFKKLFELILKEHIQKNEEWIENLGKKRIFLIDCKENGFERGYLKKKCYFIDNTRTDRETEGFGVVRYESEEELRFLLEVMRFRRMELGIIFEIIHQNHLMFEKDGLGKEYVVSDLCLIKNNFEIFLGKYCSQIVGLVAPCCDKKLYRIKDCIVPLLLGIDIQEKDVVYENDKNIIDMNAFVNENTTMEERLKWELFFIQLGASHPDLAENSNYIFPELRSFSTIHVQLMSNIVSMKPSLVSQFSKIYIRTVKDDLVKVNEAYDEKIANNEFPSVFIPDNKLLKRLLGSLGITVKTNFNLCLNGLRNLIASKSKVTEAYAKWLILIQNLKKDENDFEIIDRKEKLFYFSKEKEEYYSIEQIFITDETEDQILEFIKASCLIQEKILISVKNNKEYLIFSNVLKRLGVDADINLDFCNFSIKQILNDSSNYHEKFNKFLILNETGLKNFRTLWTAFESLLKSFLSNESKITNFTLDCDEDLKDWDFRYKINSEILKLKQNQQIEINLPFISIDQTILLPEQYTDCIKMSCLNPYYIEKMSVEMKDVIFLEMSFALSFPRVLAFLDIKYLEFHSRIQINNFSKNPMNKFSKLSKRIAEEFKLKSKSFEIIKAVFLPLSMEVLI